MEGNPANNCAESRVSLTAMLKPLSVAGMEKQSRTGRSWPSTTTTAVIEAIRVTEETNPAPMRMISLITIGRALTVSAAVEKIEHFFFS